MGTDCNQPFNLTVNDFDAKKSARSRRVFVTTELIIACAPLSATTQVQVLVATIASRGSTSFHMYTVFQPSQTKPGDFLPPLEGLKIVANCDCSIRLDWPDVSVGDIKHGFVCFS